VFYRTNEGEEERVYVFGRKVRKKRRLGRPRRRWLNNIRMDLVELGWGDVDWIGMATDRDRWRALVNAVMSRRVPYHAGRLSSVLTTRGTRIGCWWENQKEKATRKTKT
jgi:hypothetical protein